MNKEIKARIKKIEQKKKNLLEVKGRILFLYLDGISIKMGDKKQNLDDLLIDEGVGYIIDKEYKDTSYNINNNDLSMLNLVRTTKVDLNLEEAFEFYDLNQLVENEDDEELYEHIKEIDVMIPVNRIKKVKEYKW